MALVLGRPFQFGLYLILLQMQPASPALNLFTFNVFIKKKKKKKKTKQQNPLRVDVKIDGQDSAVLKASGF